MKKLINACKIITYFLSLPKSLYVCFRLLPLRQAFKLPILVRYNVNCFSLKGSAIVSNSAFFGGIKIGFKGVWTQDVRYQRSVLEINGVIEFKGRAVLGSGCQIHVGSQGHLILGNNFLNTSTGHITCSSTISFGTNALLAWDTLVMDSDFHEIEEVESGKIIPMTKPITIGDNVWLGTRSVVLKGTEIGNNTIVGATSTVSGKFIEENCIIAGSPAKVIKRNYRRKL